MWLQQPTLYAQQNPQYTQFMFNNLVINPAYAGAEEALSITVLNRNQWTGVEGAPTTQSLGAHSLVFKDKVGVGITLIYDRIGVHKNLRALSNYAYHIRLKKDAVFSFGLQAGVQNIKADYGSLAGIGNDPKLLNAVNQTLVDFGSGIFYRSKRVQAGISASKLLSNSIQFNDSLKSVLSSTNVFGYGRYQFTLNEKVQLEPGVFIKYFPNTPLSYDVNLNMVYARVLTAGFSYRKSESIALVLRFQLTYQLQLGYAYDYPIGDASQLSSASHEVMLHYVFRSVKKNVASPR